MVLPGDTWLSQSNVHIPTQYYIEARTVALSHKASKAFMAGNFYKGVFSVGQTVKQIVYNTQETFRTYGYLRK